MILNELVELCKEFSLSEEATDLMIWNEGYSLGRHRWHWGDPLTLGNVNNWPNGVWDKSSMIGEL